MTDSTPKSNTRLIPLSNGYAAIIDEADYERVSQFSWFAKKPSKDPNIVYAATSKKNGKAVRTIYMHRLIMNCPDNMQVDHLDTNRLNCRRSNLETVTQSENQKRRWYNSRKDQKP